MNFLETVWWLLLLIGVMILIHELGHFWAARFFDVKVEAFSFGFGPRLFGFRRGETDFRFSLILFGGYVKMAGEQVGEEGAADPRSFLAKPRWQRMIIAFAGPLMNIILAVVLVTGLYMVRYPKVPMSPSPRIGFVVADGAAAQAGIREGDRILKIDDIDNPTWEDITLKEIAGAKKAISFLIERDGRQQALQITPGYDDKTNAGTLGWAQEMPVHVAGVEPGMGAEKAGMRKGDVVTAVNGTPIRSTLKLHELIKASAGKPVEVKYRRQDEELAAMVTPALKTVEGITRYFIGVQLESPVTFVALPFTEALSESVRQNYKSAGLIFQFLRGIVERRMSPKSLEGPIRIAQISTDAAHEGPASFVGLMAMVSLNLAVFNLLPIPILDGGVIMLLLVEMLMRRDLSMNVKEAVFKVGFVFLMMVVAFVIYNDISKVFLTKSGG
ncbi:MAG: RIP metalloprotease RseP [Bryobacteraceae bacterium]|nr:RIP metalloprotease RseP [Bryobacteraceae bacterium]